MGYRIKAGLTALNAEVEEMSGVVVEEHTYTAQTAGFLQGITTNVHQQVLLGDYHSGKHLIRTIDFDVPCRRGHHLALWKRNGDYEAAWNMSTDQIYVRNSPRVSGEIFLSALLGFLIGLILLECSSRIYGYRGSVLDGLSIDPMHLTLWLSTLSVLPATLIWGLTRRLQREAIKLFWADFVARQRG